MLSQNVKQFNMVLDEEELGSAMEDQFVDFSPNVPFSISHLFVSWGRLL